MERALSATEQVLTAAEHDTLEALAERLIPSDERGPGAGRAGAADYISRALAGPYGARVDDYRTGLAALMHARFASLEPQRQDELLGALERSPRAEQREFFELVRAHVLEGMFGDPHWGGNRDGAGWRLLDYPGPRREWTEREQQLDVAP